MKSGEIRIVKKREGMARKISENYEVTNLLTKEFSDNVSLAVSEAKNHSEKTMNARSDRLYYVLNGRLVVRKDDKEFIAEPGDAILIPRKTEYSFEGTFKAILINTPAFSPGDERIAFSRQVGINEEHK